MAKNKQPVLDPADSFRDSMSTLISERWESVWRALPAAIAGEDPEGVHDVRVASRRLRAAMDVAVDLYPKSWYKPLHRAAKEITTELGEVRDRDVLLEFLYRERSALALGEQMGIDRLIARIEAERTEAREEMLAYLEGLGSRGIHDESRKRFPGLVGTGPVESAE